MHALLRFLSRIWLRLFAFNVLLIFLLALGLLSLETYEQHLLELQERSMVQQGRVYAAALEAGAIEGGGINAEHAEEILRHLEQRTEARLRVIDRRFKLLADSARLGPRREAEPEAAPQPPTRESWTYRIGSFLYGLYARLFLPPEPPVGDAEFYATSPLLRGPEILEALEGRYGRRTRITPGGERSVTLYSAIPVRSEEEVVGVVLVSRSTYQILQALYDFRLSAFRVILASIAAAVILSLMVGTTIARPLGRLRSEARALLDRRGRLRGRFKARKTLDEIGDLSRALAELTRRLEEHQEFMESFASDLSHEFKNPLASIHNVVEILAEADDPDERRHFVDMAFKDLARLEHLLSEVREIAQIDAGAEEPPTQPVELDPLVKGLLEQHRLRHRERALSFEFRPTGKALTVEASPERLAQVVENLLDNAASFSPAGGLVTVELEHRAQRALLRVIDQGPGIPPEHLERVFARFFSYRPDEPGARQSHSGLGLAIVKSIVDSLGGQVWAGNSESGGAVVEVEIPLVAT